MPPRLASAAAGVVAPVPPLAVEIGPARASVTFPLDPPPLRPVPAVTAVMPLDVAELVDAGKVWPGAKLIRPFGLMARPVGVGVDVPDPKSSFKFAVGLAVLLPELAVCQTKFCGTDALLALE
jgi:hypothetical protein